MPSSRRIAHALILGGVLAAFGAGAVLGYGGGLGPAEKDANGHWTDYRNPQPDAGQPANAHPRRYHVTVCSDNTWYGPWVPPEWRGRDDARVLTDPPGRRQNHGYAKGSDGTEGGLQVMGGGTGSADPASISFSDIALSKDGVAIALTVRVIHCPGARPYSPKNPKGKVDPVGGMQDTRPAPMKPGG